VIDSLPAVSLDEVVGAASLLTRVDQKYVVPMSALPTVVEQLALPVLEIDGRRQFSYESVYFDTPEWLTYLAAAQGRRRRFKLRTRTYVDTGTCKLELKSKGYRNETVKKRVDYDPNDRATLTARAHAFLSDHVALVANAPLAPAVMTRYRRWTFADLALGSRVTIDTDVTFQHGADRMSGMPGYAIVETKSAAGSSTADRMLWSAGYRPERIGKYALGVASLHPELPRNKWHRPLRRYVTVLD
jgi:VTC domain